MDSFDLLLVALEEKNIIVHPAFFKEFIELVDKSGEKHKILDKTLKLLFFMQELGLDMCKHPKIEHLKKEGNLYSLHINTSNHNLRVLFSVRGEGKIFLHTFFEKEGKNKTEYRSHIPIAIKRRNETISS